MVLLEKRVVRYILSGILSFAVENTSFIIFYYPLHLEVKVANIFSIGVALIVNFFVSRSFVFRHKGTKMVATKQFSQYIVLVLFNLTISTLSVAALVHRGVPGIIAKPAVTSVIVCWTYIIYKRLIFKAVDSTIRSDAA